MGDRPTLFLLPGLLCDASVWRAQVEALGEAWDVRTPDFLGFSSLTDMARAVLDQAPCRFAVAGHSMGGRVALELWALARERVAAVALLDTGAHPAGPDEPARRQVLVDLAEREGMTALAEAWLPPMVHPDRLSDRALMDPLFAMVERASPAIYRGQVRALLDRPDGFTRLDTLDVPLALIVGRQDAWSPVAQHEAMQARAPHATLTVIEDSGHMAPVERPEAVTRALRTWLAARMVNINQG